MTRQMLMRNLTGVLAAALLALPAAAGAQALRDAPYPPIEPLFTPYELEQLVAPIALYPDSLLGHVLMASTYPFEVVQAARWARDPRYGALGGEALRVALADRDWAPSVKSLIPFPQVLQMMDSNLEWLQALGDAFLAQPDDVMDAVQRLRRRALAEGRLRAMDRYLVIVTGAIITIEFAGDDIVYVPYYDTQVVYGPWPYPAYPPYYFVPPPGYTVGVAVAPGFYFFAGPVRIVRWLWAWYRWDWLRHRIALDVARYNVINVRRPSVTRAIWTHDHYHRRGVPYPTPALRTRYLPRALADPERRLDYRGYDPGERLVAPVVPRQRDATPRVDPRLRDATPRVDPRARDATPRVEPRLRDATPRVDVPRAVAPRAVPGTRAPQAARPAAREAAPAFQGYGSGAEVRREAERGRQSRQASPQTREEVRERVESRREQAEQQDTRRRQQDDDSEPQPRSERLRR